MYLKTLTDDEKQAFLELAYRAARADRILAIEEYELWKTFRWETGLLDERYSVRELSVADAAAQFKSDRSRRIAMIELAGMVMADGVTAPEEHAFLDELARAFEFDPDFVQASLAWVRKHADVMKEGQGLIDGKRVEASL